MPGTATDKTKTTAPDRSRLNTLLEAMPVAFIAAANVNNTDPPTKAEVDALGTKINQLRQAMIDLKFMAAS